jgi:hypothetical protein
MPATPANMVNWINWKRADTLFSIEFFCSMEIIMCFCWWVKRHPDEEAAFTEQQKQTWFEFADLFFMQHCSLTSSSFSTGNWDIEGMEAWDEAWAANWHSQGM